MGDRTLRELLYGKGAHLDPIACLEDITAAVAGRKLAGYPHSIWQIAGHMNYWMNYELKRIDGNPQLYPEHAIESWPAGDGPTNEKEWQDAVARFQALLEELAGLADSGPEVLNRSVPGTHAAHDSQTYSVHAVLWQMAAHNSYHLGQVALLRRCFGAWPPKRGSDTW